MRESLSVLGSQGKLELAKYGFQTVRTTVSKLLEPLFMKKLETKFFEKNLASFRKFGFSKYINFIEIYLTEIVATVSKLLEKNCLPFPLF